MSSRMATWMCAGILAVLGAGLILLRTQTAYRRASGPAQSAWRVTWQVRLASQKAGTRLRVSLPNNSETVSVLREEFIRRGLAMDVVRSKVHQNREAVCVAVQERPEPHLTVTYDVVIWEEAVPPAGPGRALNRPPSQDLEPSSQIPSGNPVVVNLLGQLRGDVKSAPVLLDRIHRYCTGALELTDERDSADVVSAIQQGSANSIGRTRTLVALCRAGGIPARIVGGLCLRASEIDRPDVWAEAWVDGRWRIYDCTLASAEARRRIYLPIRTGGATLVRATDAVKASTRIAMEPLEDLPAGFSRDDRAGLASVLTLSRLSPAMQATLSLLLLLPFGAFITAVFRNLIGVQTFGTFTPSLIAITFTYADWRTGLLILVGVLATGISGRRLLNGLHLLMVPRLGVVLTFAVLFLAIAVSVCEYAGVAPSARVVLLPTVILTMVIERFHVSAEENGLRAAFARLGWTFVVAGTCWALFSQRFLSRLVLSFPETLFVVAAGLVLVGHYSGYRLVELRRFRDLVSAKPGG